MASFDWTIYSLIYSVFSVFVNFWCLLYVVSHSQQLDFDTKKLFRSVSSDIQLRPKTIHPHVVGEGRGQESSCGFPVRQKQVLIEPVLRGWPSPSRPRNRPTAAGRQHPRDPPSALPLRTISPGPTPSRGRCWLASPRGYGAMNDTTLRLDQK